MNDRLEHNERWKNALMKLPADRDFLPVQAPCAPGTLRRLEKCGLLERVNGWTKNLRLTDAGREQRAALIAERRAAEAKAS